MLSGDYDSMQLGADRGKLHHECGLSGAQKTAFQYCLRGGTQPPRYALLGDSKGEALFYGLAREARADRQWMMIGSVFPPEAEAAADDRQQIKNRLALETVIHNPSIEVVALTVALRGIFPVDSNTGFITTAPAADKTAGYSRTIQLLEQAGKRVMFVIDNPTFPDPTSCISGGATASPFLNQFLRRKENPLCTIRYTDHLAGTQAYRQFVDNGWNALSGNPEHGGQGLPKVVSAAVQEMWKSANISFSLCPLLTLGAIEALELCGSPEQKETYLPNMISGKWTGTMNLTEPQAGSDLAAIRTRAEPQGDGTYRIFGQKIFITYGDHDMAENTIHLVLARTPDAPEGVKGISLFVVPKFMVNADGTLGERNDTYCVSIEHKLGIHASPTCVMAFGDHGGALEEEGEPALEIALAADAVEAPVVLGAMLLEEEAQVQERFAQQLPVLEQERDEQAADAAVAVEGGVDCLELRVA